MAPNPPNQRDLQSIFEEANNRFGENPKLSVSVLSDPSQCQEHNSEYIRHQQREAFFKEQCGTQFPESMHHITQSRKYWEQRQAGKVSNEFKFSEIDDPVLSAFGYLPACECWDDLNMYLTDEEDKEIFRNFQSDKKKRKELGEMEVEKANGDESLLPGNRKRKGDTNGDRKINPKKRKLEDFDTPRRRRGRIFSWEKAYRELLRRQDSDVTPHMEVYLMPFQSRSHLSDLITVEALPAYYARKVLKDLFSRCGFRESEKKITNIMDIDDLEVRALVTDAIEEKAIHKLKMALAAVSNGHWASSLCHALRCEELHDLLIRHAHVDEQLAMELDEEIDGLINKNVVDWTVPLWKLHRARALTLRGMGYQKLSKSILTVVPKFLFYGPEHGSRDLSKISAKEKMHTVYGLDLRGDKEAREKVHDDMKSVLHGYQKEKYQVFQNEDLSSWEEYRKALHPDVFNV